MGFEIFVFFNLDSDLHDECDQIVLFGMMGTCKSFSFGCWINLDWSVSNFSIGESRG